MGKNLFIAEKPSVAKEFANALQLNMTSKDGYMECDTAIVTWCVGHLVTMSYPEVYDEKYKKWSFDTLPFIPEDFKYEIIPSVKKQFNIVKGLLTREDVETIYVCTDSGREGEYIYRLVDAMAGVGDSKKKRRVWIDSQTVEEINRGIREAKDLSEYDNLSASAYLRAKEDYLMGINFSRALTLRYAYSVKSFLNRDKAVISVGRVMSCVLGMIVEREIEIRKFTETPFYRVMTNFAADDSKVNGEWRVYEKSKYAGSPKLYKENGFLKKEDAEELIKYLEGDDKDTAEVVEIEKKKESKNPPLLYNLAELQNECSKLFKISPDETLNIIQELYEKKLVTYPRTDARVLSTAVAKEIHKNIGGLKNYPPVADYARFLIEKEAYKGIAKSKYVNDKQITDHYAIIPTGQGLNNLSSVNETARKVYEVIARRFLAIFLPPASYVKLNFTLEKLSERFFFSFRALEKEGYLSVMNYSFASAKEDKQDDKEDKESDTKLSKETLDKLCALKKGNVLRLSGFEIKEGKTSPPKRYNSGSIILAMENAGQLIDDEDLRAQIKSSGIGTSATRAEILKKLITIGYINLNKKTQILTPTQMGEMIYCVVKRSIPQLLRPKLTASWELGLTMVADGSITSEEYMGKLDDFVTKHTIDVREKNYINALNADYRAVSEFYKTKSK
ncbi:MAG: type IA DNA topoisomerase [Lachnospiraceae bacterium]|nr:type IA DNA topoisomerase [Lachnospiraceae bacterium]